MTSRTHYGLAPAIGRARGLRHRDPSKILIVTVTKTVTRRDRHTPAHVGHYSGARVVYRARDLLRSAGLAQMPQQMLLDLERDLHILLLQLLEEL